MSDAIPEFPRLQPKQHVLLTRTWKSWCWTGSTEQLVRLQREAEDALASAYQSEVNAATSAGQPGWEAESAADLGSALRLRVKVTGADGKVTRTGELSAIFAEMDVREIETVRIYNEPYRTRTLVDLQLKRSDAFTAAVILKVEGDDRQWVGGTTEVLSSSLAKGKPWWGVLRRWWMAGVVALVLNLGVAGMLLPLTDDPSKQVSFFVFVAIAAAFFTPLLVIGPVLNKLFPGFEVLEAGSAPTGRRALGALVGVVSFGLGVAGVVLAVIAL